MFSRPISQVSLSIVLAFFVFSVPFFVLASVQVTALVPAVCGNGLKEIGEQCDGTDLGGATCISKEYAYGTLGCNAACSYDISACTDTAPHSGGGLLSPVDSSESSIPTSVVVRGLGYPHTLVGLFVGGERVAKRSAGEDGIFSFTTRDLLPGTHIFSVHLLDGAREVYTPSVATNVEKGVVTQISGLVFPPVITRIDLHKKNRQLVVFGRAIPLVMVNISMEVGKRLKFQTKSDANGRWKKVIRIPSEIYASQNEENARVQVQAKIRYGGETYKSTPVIKSLFFKKEEEKISLRDLNDDKKVNRIDFYLMRFWYNTNRKEAPGLYDLSDNGVLELSDFSYLFPSASSKEEGGEGVVLSVRLDQERVRIGETVTGSVFLYSKNRPVSTFGIRMDFDDPHLALEGISYGNSVAPLWIRKGDPRGKEKVFSALFPAGFTGVHRVGSVKGVPGKLFSFSFRATSWGTSTIAIPRAMVFAGGGKRLEATTRSDDVFVRPVKVAPQADQETGQMIDTIPPLPFTPAVIRPIPNKEKLLYVVFDTADRESGVANYMVAITSEPPTQALLTSKQVQWHSAGSPYLLDEPLDESWVVVQAVDEKGNVRFGAVQITRGVQKFNAGVAILVIILLMLIALFRIGRKYDGSRKLKLAWARIRK